MSHICVELTRTFSIHRAAGETPMAPTLHTARFPTAGCLAIGLAVLYAPELSAQTYDTYRPKGADAAAKAAAPQEISLPVRPGVRFLLGQQRRDGGWNEGADEQAARSSCVAHTAVAALALLRAGCHPRNGPCADRLERAVLFVCAQVEKSGKYALFLSPPSLEWRCTPSRYQLVYRELGGAIDASLALMLLAEVKGCMAGEAAEQRVAAAAATLLARFKVQQDKEGTWLSDGAVPALCHALAIKALTRARVAGLSVDKAMVDKAVQAFGNPKAFPTPLALGSSIHKDAALLSTWQDALAVVQQDRQRAEVAVRSAVGDSKSNRANYLESLQRAENTFKRTIASMLQQVDWKAHLQNAKTAGGNSLMSYLILSELLLSTGAPQAVDWNEGLAAALDGQQNSDGSWAGNSSGAGKNFATAMAMLVVLADRSPAVLEAAGHRSAEPPSMLDTVSSGRK
jgi:hypothetical protein